MLELLYHLLCILIYHLEASNWSPEVALYNDLFSDYVKEIRPALRPSDAVNVSLAFDLQHLIGIVSECTLVANG